jgi:hypothetical protein
MPKPDCRSIADAMVERAASYVLMAPPEERDGVTASITEGFRDACNEYGIPIEPGDLAYYVKIVTAKVTEMSGAVRSASIPVTSSKVSSPPTCRCCRRLNSNLSSTYKRRARWASKCRRRCRRSPMS